ncbi:50S ribosomal protein L24 [Boudabousia liubingyangii]|uniref:Large ribosomal subunit protein uL24 n=1 Tax=Boudabousia liubingyangii TaxID=1921764 RepID=A0A1Q5PQH3_9ACTO|nr:50S ribosomal protein L24 [Boudabousia liubingyangii]OKL48243.1 50S ribosomal protein L24 [Boudabousia liubingyangii]OKL49722.1 50S ribosomal protein L24 [Boudabousia liubingyangii]
MGAKIKKGDLVEVIVGRPSDAKKIEARNATREAKGKAPLTPGDKGKQGVVIEVLRETNRVVVEGVNVRTHHVRQGQSAQGQVTGGIEHREAPIHVSNVALVDPDTKKPVRVGFKEVQVERDGRVRTKRVRVIRGGENDGKEI